MWKISPVLPKAHLYGLLALLQSGQWQHTQAMALQFFPQAKLAMSDFTTLEFQCCFWWQHNNPPLFLVS